MWIKICGTTNAEDALLAAQLGADALGFIFAPSRRQVTAAQARTIIAALPAELDKVGVFTAGSAEEISATAREAGLTAIQLHRPLERGLLKQLRAALGSSIRFVQVVTLEVQPVDPIAEMKRFKLALQQAFAEPELFAILLDAAKGNASGGLGMPLDWDAASRVVEEVRSQRHPGQKEQPHIVLAGGLRAGNVRDAVRTLRPWGVDVVSGVEASPGIKNPVELQAFIAAVIDAK